MATLKSRRHDMERSSQVDVETKRSQVKGLLLKKRGCSREPRNWDVVPLPMLFVSLLQRCPLQLAIPYSTRRRHTMEEQQINETVLELVKSFQETNQAMAASIVAAQERNLKLAQGVYQHAMEAFQGQAESTRTLMEDLGQHARRQQERFQQMTGQEVSQKA